MAVCLHCSVWLKRRPPGPGSGRFQRLLLCWGHDWEERCSGRTHGGALDAGIFAKTHSQGSKADRDYWCTTQDSDGTRDRKVRLPGNGESGRHCCFSVSVSFGDCAITCLCFFQCILALDFCSLMTTTCLGLAWNCSVPSFSSPYSSTA